MKFSDVTTAIEVASIGRSMDIAPSWIGNGIQASRMTRHADLVLDTRSRLAAQRRVGMRAGVVADDEWSKPVLGARRSNVRIDSEILANNRCLAFPIIVISRQHHVGRACAFAPSNKSDSPHKGADDDHE